MKLSIKEKKITGFQKYHIYGMAFDSFRGYSAPDAADPHKHPFDS